ncbi:zinc finger MYM-type protein 1-like [Thrips palmi]|uniref:Zinc finger MYM-type protein 1-like n=1 Tax=Thrips palmi TaxID=161013 RepID=A0A6P8Y9H6_THRPL|nr:zinc finger MYM-type protein 1-like [Thrips palmi]
MLSSCSLFTDEIVRGQTSQPPAYLSHVSSGGSIAHLRADVVRGLNESQAAAFESVLQRRVALVQGPPGTGKTYLGCKIAEYFVSLKGTNPNVFRGPILVVTTTNHAVHEFLSRCLLFTNKLIHGYSDKHGRSQYGELQETYDESSQHEKTDIMREADILAMTTTRAAYMRSTLDLLGINIGVCVEDVHPDPGDFLDVQLTIHGHDDGRGQAIIINTEMRNGDELSHSLVTSNAADLPVNTSAPAPTVHVASGVVPGESESRPRLFSPVSSEGYETNEDDPPPVDSCNGSPETSFQLRMSSGSDDDDSDCTLAAHQAMRSDDASSDDDVIAEADKDVDSSFGQKKHVGYNAAQFPNDPAFYRRKVTFSPEEVAQFIDGEPCQPRESQLLGEHESSKAHVEANIARITRSSTAPINASLDAEKNAQVRVNREIVKQLFDITLYLARHNMAFRGHRENWNREGLKGNYRDLIELLSKYSPELAKYVKKIAVDKKDKFNYISWQRQNQMMDALCKCITSEILGEIKDAKFFSVQMDGAFDKSKHEQLAFSVRYADVRTGTVHERLLAVRPTPSSTGAQRFKVFVEVCEALGLDWRRFLVGQAYDGALNMRGHEKGLQQRVRDVNPAALYIWCHAHRLNLVVSQRVETGTQVKELFGNLEKVYDFIGNCKTRVHLFEKIQKEKSPDLPVRRLKRCRTTRWFSHSAALDTVWNTYDSLLDTLATLRDEDGAADSTGRATASSLYEYFFSEKFVLHGLIFQDVFRILQPVNTYFQKRDIDLLGASNEVRRVKDEFSDWRSNSDELWHKYRSKLTEFASQHERDGYELTPLPVRRLRRKRRLDGELASDEPVEDPYEKFRIDCFVTTLDVVSMQLNVYFNDSSLEIIRDISLLSRRRMAEVRQNSESLPADAFEELCEVYKNFLDREKLIDEYKRFCHSFVEFDRVDVLPTQLHRCTTPQSGSDADSESSDSECNTDCQSSSSSRKSQNSESLLDIFKIFCKSNLHSTFPTLSTALTICVTLPVSSTTPERAFSKLNLIKTKLRTTMEDGRAVWDVPQQCTMLRCFPDKVRLLASRGLFFLQLSPIDEFCCAVFDKQKRRRRLPSFQEVWRALMWKTQMEST